MLLNICLIIFELGGGYHVVPRKDEALGLGGKPMK